jgi:hypothetical protein
MKVIVILTAALVIGFSPMIGETSEFMGPVPTIPLSLNGSDWQRMDPGTWEANGANGKSISYRIDRKKDGGLLLYSSVDGFKWEVKNDQVWNDGEGNYFRVVHNNVAFSDDGGISWTELKHCVWQDTNGRWMMLDGEGRLWRMKEKEKELGIQSN